MQVGINDFMEVKQFQISQNYPNPVQNLTTVSYSSPGGKTEFRLSNLAGQSIRVFTKENSLSDKNSFQLNLNGFFTRFVHPYWNKQWRNKANFFCKK